LIRQRGVEVRADALARKIHKQMTAPATLTLAGGIGFIIGEFTQHQPLKSGSSADKLLHSDETSPLEYALKLMATARTAYTALPVIWMIKSYLSGQEPNQQGNNFRCSK
jgi:hypothetical protein